jgi:hypothetical protein
VRRPVDGPHGSTVCSARPSGKGSGEHRERGSGQARLGDVPHGPSRRPRHLRGRRDCCHACRLWPPDPSRPRGSRVNSV